MQQWSRELYWSGAVLICLMVGGCEVPDWRNADSDSCAEADRGSGVVVTESRAMPPFSRLILAGPGQVRVTQGSPSLVEVRTDDNLLDRIETSVVGDTLTLDINGRSLCPTKIEFEVTTDRIDALEIGGFGSIAVTGAVETEELSLSIGGAGDIILRGPVEAEALSLSIGGFGRIVGEELRADLTYLSMGGSGDMVLGLDTLDLRSTLDGFGTYELSGTAELHDLGVDGAGDVHAHDLLTTTTRVDIGGFSACDLSVEELLDVNIGGIGNISYCGTPRVVTRSTKPMSSVYEASPDRCRQSGQ